METFGTDDIRRAIGEASFSRGQDYFECGMVQSVEFKTPCRIHGRVSGSGSNVYSVSAILTFEANAMPGRVEGHCSCPVGFNCKHVAALLLAARGMSERRTGAHGPADPALLPGEVSRWLDLWPGRIAPALEVRPPGPPAPGQEHLFYVIHRDRMRGMSITPYRAYLKKDETIGSNFQEFNRRSSWGRKNLTVQDAAILGKLDFFADSGFQPSYDWPDGEELTGLVREIVETGRARAGEIRGMALSWSPPRRLDLAWEVGPSGEQSIVARDGAGSTMTLLPFPSPFFLDPATGETGVAETSLSPRMAGGPFGGELALVQLDEVFGLAAGAVDIFIEMAGVSAERGDDVAGVEAARGGLQPGDDPAFAVPRTGGVVEGGEAPHLFGADLGAAHLEVVGDAVCEAVQHGIARQAEDVVDAVLLAPRHGLRAAVVAVSPEG